ncbi:MAG TPA: hypothetical protein VN783_08330 [Thermoanaerobaculia bacterium]|nr:hypothetical protein [Thermoanaerobaculia bacterium]
MPRPSARPVAAALALAALLATPAARAAGLQESWLRGGWLARLWESIAPSGLASLFAPEGSFIDPNGRTITTPAGGGGTSDEGTFIDPNGQPRAAAAASGSRVMSDAGALIDPDGLASNGH